VFLANGRVLSPDHSIDQHRCRWLLMSPERLQGNTRDAATEIPNVLGVRREGVMEAALKPQLVGLIGYRCGCIEVLDRPSMERRSCECRAAVRAEYERLPPKCTATWIGGLRHTPGAFTSAQDA